MLKKILFFTFNFFAITLLAEAQEVRTQVVQNMQPQTPSSYSKGPSTQQRSNQIQWMTNYSEAAELAKKENKPLLLFFTGSDWCGWCKKLQTEVFNTSEFANMVGDRFVFVELDFPMSHQLSPQLNEQNTFLKRKYGITGYPTIVILDSNQSFIAETGYRPGGGKAYADYLLSLIQK